MLDTLIQQRPKLFLAAQDRGATEFSAMTARIDIIKESGNLVNALETHNIGHDQRVT